MKIAVTGCNGRVGKRVVALALKRGHGVVGIDISPQPTSSESSNLDNFIFHEADLLHFGTALKVLDGCEGVIHLAGIPNPGDYKVSTHNSNVTLSWNVLRACAELGINRVAQASSVNVLTMAYCQDPRHLYFPIDEKHPCNPDEPYGLSKLICEIQAETIVRRYQSMVVASLRLHWSVADRSIAGKRDPEGQGAVRDLWGYVQQDSAADAFLLALTQVKTWSGHEAFFIVSPTIANNAESKKLKEKYFANVLVAEGWAIEGQIGFFNCSKAERLLDWRHRDEGDDR